MKILVLISSVLGENSAGKDTMELIMKYSKVQQDYRTVIMKGKSNAYIAEQVRWCELLIVVASPFHMGIQAEAKMRFLQIAESNCFNNKPTTFFVTSGGAGDNGLLNLLKNLFRGFGARTIPGYSCIDYTWVESHGAKPLKTDRAGNNLDDMIAWLESITAVRGDITSWTKALIVKATNDDAYFNECRAAITKCYPKAEVLDVASMNLNTCKGCKLCYTTKTNCPLNDRYLSEVGDKIYSFRKVFFIAEFQGEGISPIMDNIIQRSVFYGLYAHHNDPQHNIFLFKTNGASPASIEDTRTHYSKLNSMEMNFYSIYFDTEFNDVFLEKNPDDLWYDEVIDTPREVKEDKQTVDANGNIVKKVIIERTVVRKKRDLSPEEQPMTMLEFDMARHDYQLKKNAFPNVTGDTRMLVRHFARLTLMLRNLLPIDYEFYKDHPMVRQIGTYQNIRPIVSPEDLATSAKFKNAYIREFNPEEASLQNGNSTSILEWLRKRSK